MGYRPRRSTAIRTGQRGTYFTMKGLGSSWTLYFTDSSKKHFIRTNTLYTCTHDL